MSSTLTTPKGSDEFVSEVTSVFDVMAKHSRTLIAVAVLVVLVAAGIAVMASHNEQKSDAGRNALYLAQKSLDTQLGAMAKANAPAPEAAKDSKDKKAPAPVGPDSIMFQKLDVDTQLADSVGKLRAVATDFATTRPGFEAMLLLGKTYLNHGNAAKAADWFRQSTEHAPSTLDRALAWTNLGYANENQSKYKEALDAFNKALDLGEASLKGDLLLSKARVLTSLNDVAQAKTVYELIATQLPNTEYAKNADLFKARLK